VKLPSITPAMQAKISTLMSVNGITPEEYRQALEWLSNPTIRPIVPIREFINSPYYMAATDDGGRSTIYDEVMLELEKMNNGDYSEAVLTGSIGCVDADTEFLTQGGWRTIGSYSGGLVGQYVPSTGKVELVQPLQFVDEPCDEFIHFKTKYGVDQMLSEEHRVLFRQPKSKKLQFIRASEVEARHANTTYGFGGKLLTTFSVDGDDLNSDALRVQVMVCADGWIRNTETGMCYVNLSKDRKISRARRLLEAANIPYTEFKENVAGLTRFSFHAPWKTKLLSSFCWGLSSRSLKVIVDECLHWDGHKTSYFTTIEAEASFLSYAGSACGYRTVVDFDARALSPHWIVRFNPNTEITMMGTPKTEMKRAPSPDGRKYCFTVPSGILVLRRNGRVFLTGNSAKTTAALYTTAYQLYILSCYASPHALYELDPASEIVFIFQSLNLRSATNDYERFVAMIEKAPYFQKYFKHNPELTSQLRFPNRIIVKPVSGAETATIGENVFGGMIDEINFMSVVSGGKSTTGDTGVYDQAVALYNSISKRRKSRFGKGGKVPGMLCLVSSRRYPGQFTDVKEAEQREDIRKYGKSSIYIYDKRTWEIKPPGSFSDERFKVFIGDEARRPRILEPGEYEKLPESYDGLVMDIPVDFIDDFERDILGSLRDIAGVATLAKHPFIVNRESISKAQRKTQISFNREWVDFEEVQLLIDSSQIIDPKLPRFFHCDLAITGDSAGFAIGTVPNFRSITSVDGATELLPYVHIDALLEIRPPKGREIKLNKVRDIIHALRQLGVNVRWGTFDQFQSRDSMQLLKQAGLSIGYQSVDINTTPYDFVKNALYDGRLSLPTHNRCALELASLEKNVKKNKVDHPPGGCFVGETMISLEGGGSVALKDMRPSMPWAVRGFDLSTNTHVTTAAILPRITKYAKELIEVETQCGFVVRCTPDHRFLLRDGRYVAAQDLTPDDELMS